MSIASLVGSSCGVMWSRVAVIFVGGFLGTAARVGLLDALDSEPVALGAANLLGCLMLGLISGYFGPRVTLLRLFLAVGGVAAFTSWSSLALQGIESPGAVVIVLAETVAGIVMAGLGHLVGQGHLRRSDKD